MSNKYTFKIYPPGMSREVNRTLEISGRETLDTLCHTIVTSFDFIDEHMYEFCMGTEMFADNNYQSHPEFAGQSNTKIAIDKLNLVKGQNFYLHYDFGDDWVFVIHVQKIEPEEKKSTPKVIKSKGKIVQYPGCEDEDWGG